MTSIKERIPHEDFMKEAVRLSKLCLHENQGGPFGCVVVKEGRIVGRGYNKVTGSNDPTAHAEIVAIREACSVLGTYSLEGCEIYTSCEPCPMCMGAIYWSRPDIIYYANTRADAAAAGFDDSFIYDELEKDFSCRRIPFLQMDKEEALSVFKDWEQKKDKTLY